MKLLYFLTFGLIWRLIASEQAKPTVIPDSIRLEVADSLKRAILAIYPLELLDSARVESTFAEFAMSSPSPEIEGDNLFCDAYGRRHPGSLIHAVQCCQCDPLLRLIMPEKAREVEIAETTVEAESLHYGYERIILRGPADTPRGHELLDSTLRSHYSKEAILLDFRWASAKDIFGVLRQIGLLISENHQGIGLRTRLANTNESALEQPQVNQATNMPYQKPLGILTPYDWNHLNFVFEQLHVIRRWTLAYYSGACDCPVLGVEPTLISLPHGFAAEVPTSTYLDWSGKTFISDDGYCAGCSCVIDVREVLWPRVNNDDDVNNMIYWLRDMCEEYDPDTTSRGKQ